MPLGKLSRKQIQKAYSVLTTLLQEIKGDKNPARILDGSNQFYTLIPHDFGMQKPPLLETEEVINTKTLMLDNLMEIELAYSILKSDVEDGDEKDPLDVHFEKLHTDMGVVSKSSQEYKDIVEYVRNTHGGHSQPLPLGGNGGIQLVEETRIKTLQAVQRLPQSNATVARIKVDQLCWYFVSGSEDSSARSTFHRLHVWQRGVLCRHGVQKCQLLLDITEQPDRPHVAVWSSTRRHVSSLSFDQQLSCSFLLFVCVGMKRLVRSLSPNYQLESTALKGWAGQSQTLPTLRLQIPEQLYHWVKAVHRPITTLLFCITSKLFKVAIMWLHCHVILCHRYIVYDVAQINMKYLIKMNFKY